MSFMYTGAKMAFAQGQENWASAIYKVVLVNAGYVASTSHLYASAFSGAEVSGASVVSNDSLNRAELVGPILVWSGLSAGSVAACIVARERIGRPLTAGRVHQRRGLPAGDQRQRSDRALPGLRRAAVDVRGSVMSLVFCDGMAHYDTVRLPLKYSTVQGDVAIVAGEGPFGGPCLRAVGAQAYVTKTVLSAASGWTLNVALRAETVPQSGAIVLAALRQGATVQADLRYQPDGTLLVTRGGSGLSGACGTTVLTTTVWHQLEWFCAITSALASTGCVVKVDGAVYCQALSGESTRVPGTDATAQTVQLGNHLATPAPTLDFADFTALDHQGPVSAFMTPTRVLTLPAVLVGQYQAFTPSSAGAGHVSMVAQGLPDDETTYLSAGA